MQSPPVRAMADYFLKDHQRSTFNDKPSTFNPRFACFHARLPDAIKRERPRSQVVICQVADRIRKPSVKKISERYVQHSNLQPSTFNLPRPNVPTFHVQRPNVQPSTFNLQPSPLLLPQRPDRPGRERIRHERRGKHRGKAVVNLNLPADPRRCRPAERPEDTHETDCDPALS
jgi:hypothetical protein